MSVFQKLQDARVKLQEIGLKKSGKNSYAGYDYFELADFLPQSQKIFKEIGLCGVVSFTSDLATLTIHDTESEGIIVFSSPMGSAALKGCHEVQNIGATETYQRRYLWVTAMEIVEHDPIDPITGKNDPNEQKAPKKSNKYPAPNSENISPDTTPNYLRIGIEQIADISKLANDAGVPIEKILDAAKVSRIDDIPIGSYGKIINRLNKTLAQKQIDGAKQEHDEGRDWE